MLQTKIPVIKEYYRRIPKQSRLFADASKSYIDSFLQSNREKSIMLKILSLLNPWIKFCTNVKLVEAGFLPITSDEKLELILTGSVVFNHYFKDVLESSDSGILSTIRSFFTSEDKNNIKNISGISDMLGELIINCIDSNRFEQIERFAINSIIEYFDFIGNLLDKIYTKDSEIIKIYLSQHKIDSSIDLDIVPEALVDIQRLMSSPIFSFSYEMLVKNKTDGLRKANFDMITEIATCKEKLGFVQNIFNVFPYYYYLLRKASRDNLHIAHAKYTDNIKGHVEYYLSILVSNGIYNSNRKSQLFASLIDTLNNYKMIEIPILNTDMKQIVNIPSNLHTNNFIIRSKPDKYIYNTPDGIKSDKTSATKCHSIIVDQTYGRVTRSRANIDDADTVKLVLNIDYGSVIGFNCEIFKISIKRFLDTSYGKYFSQSAPVKTQLDGSETIIFMKSVDDIMNELFKYLFDETEFLPWNISNMDNILYKLLLLMKLNHPRTLEQVYLSIDNPDLFPHEVFFDVDYDTSSFLKLVWIDQRNNRDSTIVGQELIRFILITKALNKLNPERKQKVLRDFSYSYGTDDIDIDMYNTLIQKFYSDLQKIITYLLQLKQ